MLSAVLVSVVVAMGVAACGGEETSDCINCAASPATQEQEVLGTYFSIVSLSFTNDAMAPRKCSMSYEGTSSTGAPVAGDMFSAILQPGESRTGQVLVGVNTYLQARVSCYHVLYPTVKLGFLTTRATTPTSTAWSCVTHYTETLSSNGELVESGDFSFDCGT